MGIFCFVNSYEKRAKVSRNCGEAETNRSRNSESRQAVSEEILSLWEDLSHIGAIGSYWILISNGLSRVLLEMELH